MVQNSRAASSAVEEALKFQPGEQVHGYTVKQVCSTTIYSGKSRPRLLFLTSFAIFCEMMNHKTCLMGKEENPIYLLSGFAQREGQDPHENDKGTTFSISFTAYTPKRWRQGNVKGRNCYCYF